jgi:Holliday junction DNA helicase RuvA
MIGRLRGELVERGAGFVVIDVGGVGYHVRMGTRQLADLPDSDEIVLSIQTQVREDDISLFGFHDTHDRDAFRVLLSVSGVGPKAAIALLGALPLHELASAIESENIAVISKAPGIGAKTAKRLALELKGKLCVGIDISQGHPSQIRSINSDPLPLALAQLGYRKSEIDVAINHLAEADMSTGPIEKRLSAALRALTGGSV